MRFGPIRLRSAARKAGLVLAIVAGAYVAGYRYERAVLRILPEGDVRGSVVVNRVGQREAWTRLGLQGMYDVHPRDFQAEITVLSGSVTAEYICTVARW
jgi:hypothetical protein